MPHSDVAYALDGEDAIAFEAVVQVAQEYAARLASRGQSQPMRHRLGVAPPAAPAAGVAG